MNQAHMDMDDCADWAQDNPVTRRAFIPQGCDQQGRYEATIQPQPAEACTELGAEQGEPLTAQERLLFWAVVNAAGVGFFGVIGYAVLVRFGYVQ